MCSIEDAVGGGGVGSGFGSWDPDGGGQEPDFRGTGKERLRVNMDGYV